jgi:hypothetical protein
MFYESTLGRLSGTPDNMGFIPFRTDQGKRY